MNQSHGTSFDLYIDNCSYVCCFGRLWFISRRTFRNGPLASCLGFNTEIEWPATWFGKVRFNRNQIGCFPRRRFRFKGPMVLNNVWKGLMKIHQKFGYVQSCLWPESGLDNPSSHLPVFFVGTLSVTGMPVWSEDSAWDPHSFAHLRMWNKESSWSLLHQWIFGGCKKNHPRSPPMGSSPWTSHQKGWRSSVSESWK